MNKKLVITAISSLLLYGTANAQEAATADSVADVKFIVDNLWILISAALVFIMHLGFSALESGLCQKKNVVNVLFKNVFIICMGIVTYYFIGFNTHYPGEGFNGILKFGGMAEAGPQDGTRFYQSLVHGTGVADSLLMQDSTTSLVLQ